MKRLSVLAFLCCLVSSASLLFAGGVEARAVEGPAADAQLSGQLLDSDTQLAAPDRSTAKGEIAYQLALIRAGKTVELRACFTKRQRESITDKAVLAGQASLKGMTIDDLVHRQIPSEWRGKKNIKIKMKNGRTLTTLVQEGKGWLADTVWFK